MKFKPILAAFLLCAASAFAQGTIRFDLGNSTFHATLTLDASLVYPNSIFWPGCDGEIPVAETGLTVTSPDYTWADGTISSYPTESGDLGYSHIDENGTLHLFGISEAGGRELLINGSIGGYAEMKEVDNTTRHLLYYTSGPWQETIVPEPSAAALLGLGLLALYMKRAANR